MNGSAGTQTDVGSEAKRIFASNTRERNWTLALTAGLVALYCGWVLWLPCFPSEDGPVHVYYAMVSRSLLAGHNTFAGAFRIAHRLPPYSLHAYLLMWMMGTVSGVTAEKLLAAMALISAAAGFAYFCRQIGRSASAVTLLAIPFFAHRYLFIGFYGFSIGIGFALLAMGIWSRPDRRMRSRRIAFVGLAWLTSFTHPVPYALLLAYGITELLAGGVLHARDNHWQSPSKGDVLTLGAATAAALYVAAYAHSGALWTFYSARELAGNLVRIVELLRLGSVLPLNGKAYEVPLRVVFFAMFAAATYRACMDFRQRRFTHAQLALAWGVLMIFVIPFAPDRLNGSYVFADRLSVWSVLMILAAASTVEVPPRMKRVIAAAAGCIAIYALAVLSAHMLPIARRIDASQIPVDGPPGGHVMLVHRSNPPADLSYDPYTWAAVRIVERQQGVLVAAPWLNLQIMMLSPIESQKTEDDAVNDAERISKRLQHDGLLVITRCGQPQPPPASWVKTEHDWEDKYYPGWTLQNYSCFGLLRP